LLPGGLPVWTAREAWGLRDRWCHLTPVRVRLRLSCVSQMIETMIVDIYARPDM
jgi:hypothetical protein